MFDQYSVPDADGTAPTTGWRRWTSSTSPSSRPPISRAPPRSAQPGYISLPLIKDVKASGKTTDQLQRDIADEA